MFLIHAADLHLDSPLLGLERYPGAPVHRLKSATRAAFENLIELALGEGAKLVVLSGDLYDEDWRDYGTGLFFAEQMNRLERAKIRVVWIRGNHDAASQITRHLTLPDNVRELSHKKPETIRLEDLGVAIHGQSFSTRDVSDNLARSYPDPLPGLLNVGLLHTSVTGREGHAPYAPCSLADLVDRGYEYWALGHVHRREVLSERPFVVFPGNLQGRHVRETGAKGATLVEVDGPRVLSVEHRALDVVRWVKVEVDAEGAGALEDVLERAEERLGGELALADGRLLAARVRVSGRSPAHAELVERQDELSAEIRRLAARLGGEELWLEKIELSTLPEIDLGELAARDDALGEVVRGIAALRADDAELEALSLELRELGKRLRGVLGREADELGFSDPARLRELLDDAERELLPRLLGSGERA
jgi:DNA repair exonuclease SbcCD nuclease subunit